MDDSLYDEFGNYIGPELDSEEEDSEQEEEEDEGAQALDGGHGDGHENGWLAHADGDDDINDDMDTEGAVVLAEDKKYYPTAMEVYGEGVETLVMDEDAQPLEQPIIKPISLKKFEVVAKEVSTYVATEFLLGLMANPTLIRNVALIGHLHHGKTLIMDMLFQQTHAVNTLDPNSEKHLRYTDTRIDEQERQISIKTVPMSLVLEDSAGKSYLCNIMDTPGHVNFSDEMTAALRLADGAVLVVDAVEGVMVRPFSLLTFFFLSGLSYHCEMLGIRQPVFKNKYKYTEVNQEILHCMECFE
jgi:U5 small nuclear ribonucleoprotein component